MKSTFALLLLTAAAFPQNQPADLVLKNANIYTVDEHKRATIRRNGLKHFSARSLPHGVQHDEDRPTCGVCPHITF
jgi:hypothetical protein